MGLAHDAYFIGRCGREQVSELLSVSDVCVLSSTAEGFLQFDPRIHGGGRPVVATDVGGAREAIVEGESGYLVAAGDDAQMAARLVELLRDEERRGGWSARARDRGTEIFGGSPTPQTEALYERTLQRRKLRLQR